MLDGVSLDQLRTFIAAVDEGSFSAPARKLLRAQSVVSETVLGHNIATPQISFAAIFDGCSEPWVS
jgi:Bacterial regulatory helix-turn-helix protein, lysR family